MKDVRSGRESEAATRLGRIGFDQVVGYLDGGLHSLESRPELTTSTERISAELAAQRVATAPRDEAPLTVDVRAPREREQKRIGGSVGMPLNHLGERLSELPTDRPLPAAAHTGGGARKGQGPTEQRDHRPPLGGGGGLPPGKGPEHRPLLSGPGRREASP